MDRNDSCPAWGCVECSSSSSSMECNSSRRTAGEGGRSSTRKRTEPWSGFLARVRQARGVGVLLLVLLLLVLELLGSAGRLLGCGWAASHRVPDLQLDLLAVYVDHACAKLNTDCQVVHGLEALVCEL